MCSGASAGGAPSPSTSAAASDDDESVAIEPELHIVKKTSSSWSDSVPDDEPYKKIRNLELLDKILAKICKKGPRSSPRASAVGLSSTIPECDIPQFCLETEPALLKSKHCDFVCIYDRKSISMHEGGPLSLTAEVYDIGGVKILFVADL